MMLSPSSVRKTIFGKNIFASDQMRTFFIKNPCQRTISDVRARTDVMQNGNICLLEFSKPILVTILWVSKWGYLIREMFLIDEIVTR